jgi:hypothetical protein
MSTKCRGLSGLCGLAVTVILPRRSFLTGLVGLIAAPAVVKAEALMPIAVWKPNFFWAR